MGSPALGFLVQFENLGGDLGFRGTAKRHSVSVLFGCDSSSPTSWVCFAWKVQELGPPMLSHSQHCGAWSSFSSHPESEHSQQLGKAVWQVFFSREEEASRKFRKTKIFNAQPWCLPVTGILFFSPTTNKSWLSFSAIITLLFKNHPLHSSGYLFRKGCMQKKWKYFHRKTFLYNLTGKTCHVRDFIRRKLEFKKFQNGFS